MTNVVALLIIPALSFSAQAQIQVEVLSPKTAQSKNELCPGYPKKVAHWIETSVAPGAPKSRYKLTRADSKVFQIELPVVFEGSFTDKRAMKKKVASCFERNKNVFRDKEGRSVQISVTPYDPFRLLSIAEFLGLESSSWSTPIKLGAKKSEVNSHHWSAEMPCSTIVHETLHLLGLPDEYEVHHHGWQEIDGEKVYRLKPLSERRPDYDCRSPSVRDSVMNNAELAFRFLEQAPFLTRFQCQCDARDKGCVEELQENNWTFQAICPESSRQLVQSLTREQFAQKKREEGLAPFCERTLSTEGFAVTQTMFCRRHSIPSLLKGAHFRHLIYPGCRDANEIYYQCTLNSYRTSKKAGGKGCVQGADYPEVCSQHGGAWLL